MFQEKEQRQFINLKDLTNLSPQRPKFKKDNKIKESGILELLKTSVKIDYVNIVEMSNSL